jgi:hypothetical protein
MEREEQGLQLIWMATNWLRPRGIGERIVVNFILNCW